ncbi:proteasome inhibitor PI31 subunit [Diabrotica virgifera virgifera]|uniref:Proteasome inhibitor PI31 subunit n=1 Tax=Diabrotica virgifera virgifera TaxID=50390 RepID=A0ABM5IX79_DIAVI|nr:proteasome inhibitor PI31 subunit [Diabrotica virgifera virgifera]
MAQSLFGWDLLYSSVEKDIQNNQDILVCLTHLVLVSNGFRCVGLGESKVLDGDEKKSESLPKHWNEDQNNYSIRYVYQGKLYLLKATNLDDALMVNLIRVDERTVSFLQLNKRDVATKSGSLDNMIPKHKDIVDQIKTQLIDKVIVSTKSKETGVQTECQSTRDRDRSTGLLNSPDHRTERIDFPYRAPAYGQDDLNPLGIGPLPRIPLGGGGGGMLFQPPGPSFGGGLGGRIPGGLGLPPGAVPPGARFDPFRPPDVDRFPPRRPNRPDNDEFPPPGYDDMFM